MYFLEKFSWVRRFGAGDIESMPAKTADAMAVLEEAWEIERHSGQNE
jgi:hypothetical protein